MDISVSDPAEGIRHIRLDDGDKNIFTLEAVRAFDAALAAAEASAEVNTVIIAGRSQALSVGLDTQTVIRDDDKARQLITGMGGILARLYLGPLRSIVVAQGHATAAGAMLLLVADHRVGIEGPGKIGLSEVRIGLEVPPATQQLARDRLSARLQYTATACATLFDYRSALPAGFLDQLAQTPAAADELTLAEAQRLSGFPDEGYLSTKRGMRQAFARLMEDNV